MEAGLEIYDANGKLQFNGEMLTYVLRLSGTTYVEDRKIGNTCYTSFLVPTSTTYPNALIAIGGGNGYTAAFSGTYNLGNGQYPKIYGTDGAPAGTPYQYYIFERSSTMPASNFGLEVRSAQNDITFSTSQRVMRVLNMTVGVSGFGGSGALTYPGRQLAFCQAAWAGHRVAGPLEATTGGGPVILHPDDPGPDGPGGRDTVYYYQNDGKLHGGCILDGGQTVSSGLVSYDDVRVGPQPDPEQPPDYETPLNLFVVDVTGIPVGVQFY